MGDAMVQANARMLATVKGDAEKLAARRRTTLSGLINTLVMREIEADRAVTLAAQPRPARELGQARNVTAVRLSGDCLHPIHLREQLPLHDVCRAPGCGHLFPRSR